MMSASLLLFVLFAPPAGRAAGSPAGHAYIPIAAIHSLLQRHADRATVRATLTRTGSPIYVEDSTAGAAAENAPSQGLTIGDQHLITSWPEESERGLVLQGASVRFLWPGKPMPPLAATADQAALGKFANSHIEVQGCPIGDRLHSGEDPGVGTV